MPFYYSEETIRQNEEYLEWLKTTMSEGAWKLAESMAEEISDDHNWDGDFVRTPDGDIPINEYMKRIRS